MTQRARLFAWAVVLGALGAAGCEEDNASLAAKVQSRVNRTVTSPSADIEVAVDDGVVTLSGVVPSAPLKDQAEKAARMVEGVKVVKDEIAVK